MKISHTHLLNGALPAFIPGGGAMPVRRLLVIHGTDGATGASSIAYWSSKGGGICAHLVIDRDGTIYQCRPFNRTAGHAGNSRWLDTESGVMRGSANTYGIGIELANAGRDHDALKWARRQPGFQSIWAKHRNGGDEHEWETFPPEQISTVMEVAAALCDHYNLDDITGHDCIAPERKIDPGPAFPMQLLREHCGFHGLPEVFQP